MTASLAEELLLLGVSHHATPQAIRERCSVPQDRVPDTLRSLQEEAGVDAACILSTCNRTEILVAHTHREAVESALRQRFFGTAAVDLEEVGPYVHHGVDAVFHLFSVAAGVDSLVLGESEILRQLKRAHALSREAGTCNRLIDSLLQQSLAVGKRVRRDTRLGEGTLSVARASTELAYKVFGGFSRVTALIIGVGETGQLVAQNLRSQGIGRLLFANRTRSRAEEAANIFDGEVVALEDIGSVVSTINLSVVSVEAPEPVLRSEHFDRARLRSHDRPTMVIDLSVPRGVAKEVGEIPELLSYGIDDLDQIVARHRADRQDALADAERILVEEAHKFLALRTYANMKPVIAGLAARFQAIEAELLEESDDPAGLLADFGGRLTKRLLAAAMEQMKEGARHTQSADALKRLFASYQRGRVR